MVDFTFVEAADLAVSAVVRGPYDFALWIAAQGSEAAPNWATSIWLIHRIAFGGTALRPSASKLARHRLRG
jgi:hypothetical protein